MEGRAHLLSACREMPVEAASEMMAMIFSPCMKEFFSAMLTFFWASCRYKIPSHQFSHSLEHTKSLTWHFPLPQRHNRAYLISALGLVYIRGVWPGARMQ